MRWRKFNGDPIEMPILDAVENAIKRETEKGYRLKVCIGTDSQVKDRKLNLLLLLFSCGKDMAVLCSFIMKKPASNSLSKKEC
jgi:predicted RNase H-related nuclease YkuK (DUF458 family)